MSWLYLPESGAECSAPVSTASEPCAQSREISMPSKCSSSVRETARSSHSRSGTTSALSMGCPGAVGLSSFLEAFPAKHSAARHLDETVLTTFGRRCGASWQMSLPGTCSPKTSARTRSKQPLKTAGLWVTKPKHFPLVRMTWVVTTFGADIGFLHTPTTKANYAAPSMQKWAGCRAFVTAFGKPSPINQEWLMGYPAGWTDTAPLVMGKFQSWRQRHLPCSLSQTEAVA